MTQITLNSPIAPSQMNILMSLLRSWDISATTTSELNTTIPEGYMTMEQFRTKAKTDLNNIFKKYGRI